MSAAAWLGEVMPVLDRETGGFDGSAQLVGGGEMAALGLVGPRQGIAGFAAVTNDDIPKGKPPPADQNPAGFGYRRGLSATFIWTCWLMATTKVPSAKGSSVTSA